MSRMGIRASSLIRPAPVILATTGVLHATTSDPFTVAHTIAAGTDGLVAVGGWVRNENKSLGTVTYGATAMTAAATAEDNDSGDRAGCYVYWIPAPRTGAQNFVADLTVGNPDEWSWVLFDLQGMNQTAPVAASGTATTSGVAAKSVTVDTSAVLNNTLVLGGRIIGRGDATPFTEGTNVTEVADDLGTAVLSLFVGKRLDMAPVSFAFACTANTAALGGDAMAAAAFVG